MDTSKFISQGSLDLAGGENYLLAMRVRSAIPTSRTVIVGDSPTTVGGSSVTLTEFVYRYESSAELGLPEEETAATYAVVPAGATGDSYVSVNAFGPQAFAKLKESGNVPSEFPGVSVITYIKARGHLGSTSNVESNEFSFPVAVFNSRCTVAAGVCRKGQDAATACVPVSSPPPTTP
ncbi:hypothetical protein [Cystobacter fuscus]|uniref:hypothetical protein n=1 Tax=Cystobacter fuscus TaxID=43 RepID=UPI0037C14415